MLPRSQMRGIHSPLGNSTDGYSHMFIDSHSHIFTDRIVKNVRSRPDMVRALKLNTVDAWERLSPTALQESAESNGVDLCVLLPTASPDRVRAENDRFIGWTRDLTRIRTLGTLHPAMEGLRDEISRIYDLGINGFKLSSFSQRFDLLSPEGEAMLAAVEDLGSCLDARPVVVFDTFMAADVYFGAARDHITTPAKLTEIARRHPGINVVCAHMGGLLGDFDEVRRDLVPAENLYLDTSNATHTFTEDQLVVLFRVHGASHILFGTDWPWFLHGAEKEKVLSLLSKAGFNGQEQAAVLGENAARLLGLCDTRHIQERKMSCMAR